MKQTKRKKRAKPRKARKVPKKKPSKPRKYFGTPSQLMVNTIIRAAVKVLRRERHRLRKLLAEEYKAIRKIPKEQSELLMRQTNFETEKLRDVILAQERAV